ncbi:hypothetical protein ANN_01950 [Periplaneta americana]|uniref:Uncharacterized protein n=1 Tax=Periplaneta americana TaxID=6978 RepID=A0ABQ8TV12_PERAM|nr:hypothetical protein ANN_01950 [Periplaneta americana]
MNMYDDDHVFNAHECGFLKVMPFGRTLERQGTSKVYSVVQSKGTTTHSYTIMPVVSKAGKLMPKLLLILQEPKGISARVSERIFQSEKLIVK